MNTQVETLLLQEFPTLGAKLDLPAEFGWFNELNVQERIDFLGGLLEVLVNNASNRLVALDEYLRGWQATVEINSSPELLASYARANADLQQARVLSYDEVFGDL